MDYSLRHVSPNDHHLRFIGIGEGVGMARRQFIDADFLTEHGDDPYDVGLGSAFPDFFSPGVDEEDEDEENLVDLESTSVWDGNVPIHKWWEPRKRNYFDPKDKSALSPRRTERALRLLRALEPDHLVREGRPRLGRSGRCIPVFTVKRRIKVLKFEGSAHGSVQRYLRPRRRGLAVAA